MMVESELVDLLFSVFTDPAYIIGADGLIECANDIAQRTFPAVSGGSRFEALAAALDWQT